jgi:uncharacterized protein (DUF433 family)
VPVHIILDLLAAGETVENILKAYPQITKEDVHECLLYAACLASEEIIPIKLEAA